MLTKPIDLDAGVRMLLLQQIGEMRGHNHWMIIHTGQLVDYIVQLRMSAPREEVENFLTRSGTVRFCRSHGYPMLPLAKAFPAP